MLSPSPRYKTPVARKKTMSPPSALISPLRDKLEQLESELARLQSEEELVNNRLVALLKTLDARPKPEASSAKTQTPPSLPRCEFQQNRDIESSERQGAPPSANIRQRRWLKHRQYDIRACRARLESVTANKTAVSSEICSLRAELRGSTLPSPEQEHVSNLQESMSTLSNLGQGGMGSDMSLYSPSSSLTTCQALSSPSSIYNSQSPGLLPTEVLCQAPRLESRAGIHGLSIHHNSSIRQRTLLKTNFHRINHWPLNCDVSRSDSNFKKISLTCDGPPMTEAEFANHIYSHELSFRSPLYFVPKTDRVHGTCGANTTLALGRSGVHQIPPNSGQLAAQSSPCFNSVPPQRSCKHLDASGSKCATQRGGKVTIKDDGNIALKSRRTSDMTTRGDKCRGEKPRNTADPDADVKARFKKLKNENKLLRFRRSYSLTAIDAVAALCISQSS